MKIAGIFIFILALGALVSSCRSGSQKAAEKIMENALENASGGEAQVDISGEKTVIETGEGRSEIDPNATSWPSEIPDDIPEFTSGKVTGVTTTTTGDGVHYNVIFEEVEDGFIDKYNAELKEKGFETNFMKIGEKGGSITVENDQYVIFLMGGEGNVSLGVTVKKQE